MLQINNLFKIVILDNNLTHIDSEPLIQIILTSVGRLEKFLTKKLALAYIFLFVF